MLWLRGSWSGPAPEQIGGHVSPMHMATSLTWENSLTKRLTVAVEMIGLDGATGRQQISREEAAIATLATLSCNSFHIRPFFRWDIDYHWSSIGSSVQRPQGHSLEVGQHIGHLHRVALLTIFPKIAGATLSGWPSISVAMRNFSASDNRRVG